MSTQKLEKVIIQLSEADNTSEKLQPPEEINLNLGPPDPLSSGIGTKAARRGWSTEVISVVITFLQNAPLFAHKMKYLKRALIYIALPLLLASSFQLFFASSALAQRSPNNTVVFNPVSYGGWQTGCHYPGTPNFAVIQLTAANHDCGATCANTTSCSYFVKTTDGPHGTCYLKSGPLPHAVLGDSNYYVCGYVENPKGQPATPPTQPATPPQIPSPPQFQGGNQACPFNGGCYDSTYSNLAATCGNDPRGTCQVNASHQAYNQCGCDNITAFGSSCDWGDDATQSYRPQYNSIDWCRRDKDILSRDANCWGCTDGVDNKVYCRRRWTLFSGKQVPYPCH